MKLRLAVGTLEFVAPDGTRDFLSVANVLAMRQADEPGWLDVDVPPESAEHIERQRVIQTLDREGN